MNPANIPTNFPQPMPFGPRPPIQQNPQRNAAAIFIPQIVNSLRGQGPFPGWRAEIQLNERTNKVFQL